MPNPPRLFVELLRSLSGDYATWYPSQKVEVGDYGVLNRHSGEFVKEGSIYDPAFEPDLKILETYPPEEGPAQDHRVLTSKGAQERSFGDDPMWELPVDNFELRHHWKFPKGRGAILVMHRPKRTQIPSLGTLLPKLRVVEQLWEKAIITSGFSTPRYAMLLTEQHTKGAEAGIALVPAVKDISDVDDSALHWVVHSSSGVWKTDSHDQGGPFYPLYTLKTPKSPSFLKRLEGFRTLDQVNTDGENAFYPYQPPGNILDEDGDEIEEGDDENQA